MTQKHVKKPVEKGIYRVVEKEGDRVFEKVPVRVIESTSDLALLRVEGESVEVPLEGGMPSGKVIPDGEIESQIGGLSLGSIVLRGGLQQESGKSRKPTGIIVLQCRPPTDVFDGIVADGERELGEGLHGSERDLLDRIIRALDPQGRYRDAGRRRDAGEATVVPETDDTSSREPSFDVPPEVLDSILEGSKHTIPPAKRLVTILRRNDMGAILEGLRELEGVDAARKRYVEMHPDAPPLPPREEDAERKLLRDVVLTEKRGSIRSLLTGMQFTLLRHLHEVTDTPNGRDFDRQFFEEMPRQIQTAMDGAPYEGFHPKAQRDDFTALSKLFSNMYEGRERTYAGIPDLTPTQASILKEIGRRAYDRTCVNIGGRRLRGVSELNAYRWIEEACKRNEWGFKEEGELELIRNIGGNIRGRMESASSDERGLMIDINGKWSDALLKPNAREEIVGAVREMSIEEAKIMEGIITSESGKLGEPPIGVRELVNELKKACEREKS